jgi:hypothetical protein
MPDLLPWLIGAALAALIALVYYWERRYPAPSKPGQPTQALAVCAWCIWRDGGRLHQPRRPGVHRAGKLPMMQGAAAVRE